MKPPNDESGQAACERRALMDDEANAELTVQLIVERVGGDAIENFADLLLDLRDEIGKGPEGGRRAAGECERLFELLFQKSGTYQHALRPYQSRFEITGGKAPEAVLQEVLAEKVGAADSPAEDREAPSPRARECAKVAQAVTTLLASPQTAQGPRNAILDYFQAQIAAATGKALESLAKEEE